MAVVRVSAAPPSILLTCLCFLFLLLRNQDICTAKPRHYIDCSVFLGFLRENPQRNAHVFFSPSCCVRHFRNFASVIGRSKKRVFAQSKIPYYSNHSAVFNIEHMTPTRSQGIEPGPHWWEASALTTALTTGPSLHPQEVNNRVLITTRFNQA